MAKVTPATLALAKTGARFTLHTYAYDPGPEGPGRQAASELGYPPSQVLKTLIALADGNPVCAVIRVDREVSMKALARALGARTVQMMAPTDTERVTGYRIGGVSPFGQKRPCPTVVDAQALLEREVFVNGGQRGLQIRLSPADLVSALGAATADIAAGTRDAPRSENTD